MKAWLRSTKIPLCKFRYFLTFILCYERLQVYTLTAATAIKTRYIWNGGFAHLPSYSRSLFLEFLKRIFV